MDDLSKLSAGLTGGTGGGDPISGLNGAIQQAGGIDGLLGKLRQGGLGTEVDSWVASGVNEPVDPQRLGAALGPDTVQQLSAGSGLDIGALLPMLAAFLPQIIDMLTPDGNVPSGGLGGAGGSMPDLGGMLGGLLGGAGAAGAAGAGGTAGGAGLDDLLGGLGGMLGGSRDR